MEQLSLQRRPNLFVIGAPKCGTTSLHYYLDDHPDIFMSRRKEPHYYCTDFWEYPIATVKSEQEYLAMFEGARHEVYCGESSVWYLYSEAAPANIKRDSPDARIICALRHPVDMMFSQFRFAVKRYAQKNTTFAEVLAQEPLHRQGKIKTRTFINRATWYRDNARFSTYLQRYLNTFGKENVCVVLFDDLKRSPAATCESIFRFLNIATDIDVDTTPRNTTDDLNVPPHYRIVRKLVRWNLHTTVQQQVPKVIKSAVRHVADRVLPAAPTPPNSMDPDLRAQLTAEFTPEIERLERLIDRDLSHWKFTAG